MAATLNIAVAGLGYVGLLVTCASFTETTEMGNKKVAVGIALLLANTVSRLVRMGCLKSQRVPGG